MAWDFEIRVLEDLYLTVPNGHVVTAHALLREMARVESTPDGPLFQRLLMAKLYAEAFSALEDLGALIWAIRHRGEEGIVRNYLRYRVENLEDVFEQIRRGDRLADVLRLPETIPQASNGVTSVWQTVDQRGLEYNIGVAARGWIARFGGTKGREGVIRVTDIYNKVKHGFVVVSRPDRLCDDPADIEGWEACANVIAKAEAGRTFRMAQIPMTIEDVNQLKIAVEAAAECWRAIVN